MVNIFFNALKKVNNRPKRTKMAFLTANSFFFAFSKIPNYICGDVVFKAESKPKHGEHFFCWFFFKNQNTLLRGYKIVVLKTQILNLFSFWLLNLNTIESFLIHCLLHGNNSILFNFSFET